MAEPKQPKKLAAIKGGLNVVKRLFAEGEEPLTAAQRAEAGRKAAELIKSQTQVKASEALGQQMEKGFKRTSTTQADRTRVGGGNIGGAPFSAISEADPAYKGKVWGVMDEGTAARLKNLTTDDTAWTTMLGSANQLKTNPIVFDKLKRGFVDAMKQGKLSDELAGRINHNLKLTFGEGADIRDPKIWKQADTFDKRAALADVMMGQGTAPGKGGVAIGGEKSGKGVIFKPTDILKRETEPSLLHTEHGGDVPTFAAGPRLFRLNKESVYRPDLHHGFPTLLTGKDLEVNMIPTPTEVYLPDWHRKFKKNNPDRKGPGYYDLALGVKGEGLPSQDLNDEYIRHLLREGYKDGGSVDINASDARLEAAIANRMAKGGEVDIEAADARLADAMAQRMAGGGKAKAVQGATQGFKRLFADRDALPAAEREANLQKFLEPSKAPMRLFHGTTATEGGKGQEAFRRIKPSKDGALGSGVYLTPNSGRASGYAESPWDSKLNLDRHSPNVLPVHAQIRNPLVIEGTGDPMIEALVKLGLDEDKAARMVERAYENKGYIGKEVESRARAAGYDGLMQYRNGDLSEVVSYNPNAIKSAIGNEGTYDTSLPDLSKAEGGEVHMQAGGKAKAAKGIATGVKRLFADRDEKIVQPPSVIVPGKLSNLKEEIRQSKGDFGARRLERAADEIPNLDKLYKEEALRQAFLGDNARAVMTMKPEDFEKYSVPLQPRFMDKNSTRYTTSGERLDYPEYMSEYLPNVGAFDDVPFLLINKEEQGLPLIPFISGHEGRHRNRVMAGKGEKAGLVQLLPRAELREPFPRRHQDEYLEALKKELEMTDNMVLPERFVDEFSDKTIKRPAIKLPDIYAEGGEVEMAGGGKAGAVKGVAKGLKRLFADRDVLPAAQREENLQKFLSRSQVTSPVFHAAKTDVPEFSPKRRTELSSMGHHFGTAEQANTRTGQYDFSSEAPNVGKYHLNVENPLEVSHMASYAPDHLADVMMDMNILTPQKYDALSQKYDYDSLRIGDELVKVLKKNGYDGLKYSNEMEGAGFSYVPFSPTQIKSATGNRGTYDLNEPEVNKAEGGAAFKKIQFMNKGGITTSGGTFSAEDLGVTPEELNAPLVSAKRLRDIKRNAADLSKEGKEQLEKEYKQLSNKGGKKDYAIRVGSQILGSGVDTMNFGLGLIDDLQSVIPALSRPESVLDDAGTSYRVPKFRLSSDEPFYGSEHFLRKFKEAELLGENEFPFTEIVANLFAPAAAVGAVRKGKQAYEGSKLLKNTPKKRRGGLTAMTR